MRRTPFRRPTGSAEQPAPTLPKSLLGPCILLLLGEQRAHGYDLLARLPDLGLAQPQRNGRYADSGTVYRTLHRLEEEGFVRSAQAGASSAPPRRVYELTPAGRVELQQSAHAVTEMSARVGAFVSRYQSSSSVRSSVVRLPSLVAQTVLRRPPES